ncbi:MAG: hypothetical protein ABI273_03315 [Lacunisphaera sp.]
MKAVSLTGLFILTLLSGIFLLHGSKGHLLLSGVAAVICVGLFFARLWRRAKTRALPATVWAVMISGGIALSYFPGASFYRSQVKSTEKKLDSVFPSLEESRRRSGAYPQEIYELLERCDLPWLTRGKVVFHSRSDFFWIYFSDVNSGLTDIFIYDSNAKAWSYRLR